jgi:hypothetical protein
MVKPRNIRFASRRTLVGSATVSWSLYGAAACSSDTVRASPR